MVLYLFIYSPHCTAFEILVHQPRIKPVSPAVEVWSLNHWTIRAVPAAAAAAAKSRQSCPTLYNPIDGGPPGSPVPGILQARILEWVAISFSNA